MTRPTATICALHPYRPAIGQRSIPSTDGGEPVLVSACLDCMIEDGGVLTDDAGTPTHEMVVLRRGAPCLCGPGFCAEDRGVGYSGVCAGSRPRGAPDCPTCGAPHQSDAGCWACHRKGATTPDDIVAAKEWVRALKLGIRGREIFDRQDLRWSLGDFASFGEIVDEIAAERAAETQP